MKIGSALGWGLVALAGCGEGNPLPQQPSDMGVAHDLADDFASPLDLSTVNDLALGNDADDGPVHDLVMSSGDVTTAHGMVYKYVVDSMTSPKSRSDYAMDLNGDGKTDNQLGNVAGALTALGFDPAPGITASVAQGDSVYLLGMQTADPMLMNDDTVGVDYLPGLKHPNPDFTGNGSFTVDGNQPSARLYGRLAGSGFTSNDPITTTHPVSLTLNLALFPGGMPVPLPLNGAHIQFVTGTDMNSGAPGLLKGQINGSIKNSDVQNVMVPGIAATLNSAIALDPNSPNTMQIEQIFDTGGCVDADGTMAKANDGHIDVCEVSMNQIILNVLSPDVQIFDQNGMYAPNPKNTTRDSLSVGLAFTAVKATY